MSVTLRQGTRPDVTVNEHSFFTQTDGYIDETATTLSVVDGLYMPSAAANVVCEVVKDQDAGDLPPRYQGSTLQNPYGEIFTYTALDASGNLTGLNRAQQGTTAHKIFNKSWLNITDTSGGDDTVDYIYVHGIKGNHVALYLSYNPTGGEAGIRITCATKPHRNTVSVAWHDVTLPDSDNKPVVWERLIDKPGSPLSDNILVPVNISDNVARIRIEYTTPSGASSELSVDVQHEINRSVS